MAREDDFLPHLGRQNSQGGKPMPHYLGKVLASANLARGGSVGAKGKGFSGSRIGRGSGVGRILASRGHLGLSGGRRAIVKASIVRLSGKGARAAAAHLRYLQRDGTTREGERGQFYGRDKDSVDAKAFLEQGVDARHQFRFIVSPEDGDQYEDLKPLTRRLMARMEEDLGTRLDWVAVDHFNTGHPHTHIVVRGKDMHGADLVIARDYLTRGIRERVTELVDLDLGPRDPREIETALRAEIEQERLTAIDRSLLRDMDGLRQVGPSGVGMDAFEQSLRAGRLAKLSRLGLAEPGGNDRFVLADDLEKTLRRMGERGDIIRTFQREFSRLNVERAGSDLVIHNPASPSASSLIGRVLARGLADEHTDRHFLIVDGIDGRSHYVPIGKGRDQTIGDEGLAPGVIVKIEPRHPTLRQADRTIAEIAATHGGRYDIDLHLRHDPSATQAYAQTHVRRLEAMRRGGGGVTRQASGQWIISPDHLARVEAWEARAIADRPVTITCLSFQSLGAMVEAEAATWIDREMVSGLSSQQRDAGFGREVREAMEQRRRWLLACGFAQATGGDIMVSSDNLRLLERREVLKVAGELAGEMKKPFREVTDGNRVTGIYRRSVEMVSGRFALIERAHDFTLVPWAKALERRAGQQVSGIMREAGSNWSIGRGRGGPSIS